MNAITKPGLVEIAERIRSRTAQAIIENGHDLLKAKAALPHGKFTAWLRKSVEMSERTAQRCMQVAEWVASLPEDKSDTVTVLPPRQLYLLSAPSTPPRAQERALRQLENTGRIEQVGLQQMVRNEAELLPVVCTEPVNEGAPTKPRNPAAQGIDLGRTDEEAEVLPPEDEPRRLKRYVAFEKAFLIVVGACNGISVKELPELEDDKREEMSAELEDARNQLLAVIGNLKLEGKS